MQSNMQRPVGNRLIPYGTPMHIRDLFVMIIKQTFADVPDNYPFKYTTDEETTGIMIDVPLNKDGQIYGKKPIIIIERGSQQTAPIVVGDLGNMQLQSYQKKGSTVINCSINILVVSKTKAEVEILSQILFNLLTICRIVLPGVVGIHNVRDVSLSQVSRFDQDDMMFSSTLNFDFSMQYRWIIKGSTNPLVAAITACVNAATKTTDKVEGECAIYQEHNI